MILPAYVLAGGASSRFGRDKAREVVRGRPLVRHAVDLASAVASPVLVVAVRAGAYDDLGLDTIGDDDPGLGPLGGLARALRHAREELPAPSPVVLLAPCDWLGARGEWLRDLVDAWRPGDGAVAFRGDHREPLPALYATDLIDAVRESLASDDRSLLGLLARVETRDRPLPADWSRAIRVDRPEDLDR